MLMLAVVAIGAGTTVLVGVRSVERSEVRG